MARRPNVQYPRATGCSSVRHLGRLRYLPVDSGFLAYTAAANAAAASGYTEFNFSGVRFIQQVGAASRQDGTEQAFVYWDSQSAPAQSDETSSTPEPGTARLFVPGMIFLAGVPVCQRVRRIDQRAADTSL